jgi:hypothetical protein
VLFVAVLRGAIMFLKVGTHEHTIATFTETGSVFADPAALPDACPVRQGFGAQGEFYLSLALNPLISRPDEFGITLDNPPHRQQQILYPLLTGSLMLGDLWRGRSCLSGWITSVWVRPPCLASSWRRAWGLVFSLIPGLLVSLSRHLVEIIAIACLARGRLTLTRRRHVIATLRLCGGVMTRETTALVPACLALAWVRILARR